MRFGRIILAGLAPLVGLSAFAAGLFPHACGASNSAQQIANPDSPLSFFAAIVPALISSVESVPAAPLERGTAHAVLALESLVATPFRRSLHLLASAAAVDLFERRHQPLFLRC
jgi:hypothetical protein